MDVTVLRMPSPKRGRAEERKKYTVPGKPVCAVAIVCLTGGAALGGSEPVVENDSWQQFSTELATRLMRETEGPVLSAAIENLGECPLYLKFSLAELLVSHMRSRDSVDLSGYAPKAGTHDFRSVAGRAAAAFESLLNLELGATRASAQTELDKVQKEAERLLSAYRAGAMHVVGAYSVGNDSAGLTTRFRDRIRAGLFPRFSEQSANAMAALLREWLPVGKELQALEDVVGKATRRAPEWSEYRFDSGYTGWVFRFSVNGHGVITGVTVSGVE